jgi:hypothetical protein
VADALVLCGAASLSTDPELDLPDGLVDRLGDALVRAKAWQKPVLPVSGKDMLTRGVAAGPQVGAALQIMEAAWIASDFTLDRDALLDVLKN